MYFRHMIAIFLTAMFLCGGAAADEVYQGKPILQYEWKGLNIEYVQGEILVGLKQGFNGIDVLNEYEDEDISVIQTSEAGRLLRLETSNTKSFFEVITRLNSLEAVRYAEPNQVLRMHALPNDPFFEQQWHYHNTGQDPPGGTLDADIDAPEGWAFTSGNTQVILGIMDTGIPIQDGLLSHPDLDDASRFIMGENVQSPGNPPTDGNGHGTHVIGTVGAETDNGLGVAGVAYDCKIIAIKVFNDGGSCTDYDLYDAIHYGVDNGCRVLNFSGGSSSGSSTEESAIAYADSNEVIIVASAGNNYGSSVSYPARYSAIYSNVIAVSATDHNDELSAYSNEGPEVTVAAPGGYGRPFDEDDVYSTFPNYNVFLNDTEGLPEDYAYLAGTSMASPHVTALAGLILSVNPTLSADSVRNIIMNTADDLGDPGFDNEFGHGRINVYNALLLIGNINIGHMPLENTKNYASDYRVDCAIFSQYPLIQSSLKLYYRIDSTSWYMTLLQPDRLLENYYAYIPFQSPGTYIDYYMCAQNQNGGGDTTQVFTFKVIDYQIIFEPFLITTFGESDEIVCTPLTITNDGVLADSYDLSLSGNQWSTAIYDILGLNPISSTPTLAPDQSYIINIKVTIPESVNGESDSVMITAASSGDPGISESVSCLTISEGAPLSIPFTENFISDEIDMAQWIYNYGTDISELGMDEPSPPYSLHFDGYPSSGDTIMSQIILLDGLSGLNLQYHFQQTGGGESPDFDNDLFVEFLDIDSNWILLNEHDGAGPDMVNFEIASIALPAEAYHDRFRIRFRNNGTYGERDDWFIDNISINNSPQAFVYTSGLLEATLGPNQTSQEYIYVKNVGAGILQYDVELSHNFDLMALFNQLSLAGHVEPANRDYPPELLGLNIQKGNGQINSNIEILYNAGGPDNFGYYWVDSDEDGGPIFDWIDISTTGTQVGGLSDDSYAGPFPIGFFFDFYGQTYSEFYISSNGFIGFGPPDNYESLTNKPIPTYDIPDNFIALLWDDLNLDDSDNPGGEVRYQNINNKLIIQYVNVPEYMAETGAVFNGEIILHSDGRIILQYLNFGSGFDKQNCTVGIEQDDGFNGLEVAYCTSFLKNNFCIAIATPEIGWLDVEPDSGQVSAGKTDTLTATFNSSGIWSGSYSAEISIFNNDPDAFDNEWTNPAYLTVVPEYYYGDANGDEIVNVSDAVYIINYVFCGGNAPNPYESGDVNCDTVVNVSDAVYIINHIFAGGSPPCENY